MRTELERKARDWDRRRERELEAEAARIARENDPNTQTAIADARLAFSLVAMDRNRSEVEVAEHKSRLEQLESGDLAPEAYWQLIDNRKREVLDKDDDS
jgi:hypothetical protein